MDIQILQPTQSLKGTIKPPGSKSYSHRALIIASLTDGVSILYNLLDKGDVNKTITFMKTVGVKILKQKKGVYIVRGKDKLINNDLTPFNCGNSGTTFRLLSALSLIIKNGVILKGHFLKLNRPIKPLLIALEKLGAKYELSNTQLKIWRENIKCMNLEIRGDISSQFITALLILGPLLKCEKKNKIEIKLTTEPISYPYIKITLELLEKFGINITEESISGGLKKFYIELGQKYRNQEYYIPSDFSSAAFIAVASILTPKKSNVIIQDLDFTSPQGDKRLFKILKKMGAKLDIDIENKKVVLYGNRMEHELVGIRIDCSDIPDLFPILCIIGLFAKGKTTLYNARTLRYKESDRISIMYKELIKMGAKVEEEEDKLTIYESKTLKISKVNHHNDHRIAMALTIARLFLKEESSISNIEIIEDSYPNFVNDLISLGARIKLVI